MSTAAHTTVEAMLTKAGIRLNGTQPWDIQVHDQRFYKRVLSQGSLGLGESYMDGWWDCQALDVMVTKILDAGIDKMIPKNVTTAIAYAQAKLFNRQSSRRAFQVGEVHYDIGNDLYSRMLDERMTYTCGYWKNADSLDAAQEAKLDLVCKKIGLKKGQRVLDIGCGWGSFAQFAAQRYGAEVTGITVSKEQAELAKTRCAGLSVEIRLQDYREVKETFDQVVSLGMFEHVGYKNYSVYMETVRRVLKSDGLFLLHTIGGNRSVRHTDAWIEKYIFPNSMLPSIAQIAHSAENKFVVEDWHNFGNDYDTTLMAWHANFEKHWPELKDKYGERFGRMWCFYLLTCAATFRSRKNQLWQIVLSPNGVKGGYQSIR
jgi:cyclopropane-fatty-acyl-phospholipid synthase